MRSLGFSQWYAVRALTCAVVLGCGGTDDSGVNPVPGGSSGGAISAGGAATPSSSGGAGTSGVGAGGAAPLGGSAAQGGMASGMSNAGGSASEGSSVAGETAGGQASQGGASLGAGMGGQAGAAAGAGAGARAGAGGAASPGGSSSGQGGVDQSALPGVTLHLAGDSTVMTYDAGSAQEGWGQELGQYFISKLKINNQAIGGASVKTFQSGRWANILSALKGGDYVMMQFGTNDSGSVSGRHVEVAEFSRTLADMAAQVSGKRATPLFVTPSALQEWSGGKEGNTRLGPYADAMRALGPTKDVLVDDLNARSVEYLNMIGQMAAMQIYIDGDKAHFTKKGATQMAMFVAQELGRIGSPLAAYLKP